MLKVYYASCFRFFPLKCKAVDRNTKRDLVFASGYCFTTEIWYSYLPSRGARFYLSRYYLPPPPPTTLWDNANELYNVENYRACQPLLHILFHNGYSCYLLIYASHTHTHTRARAYKTVTIVIVTFYDKMKWMKMESDENGIKRYLKKFPPITNFFVTKFTVCQKMLYLYCKHNLLNPPYFGFSANCYFFPTDQLLNRYFYCYASQ